MKTSYLTHTLIALILATTLASCGGKNQTGGQRATPTPQQTQDEREALDSAIENSRISRELLGAKASERHSFEMDIIEKKDGLTIYIYGREFEVDKAFSQKVQELSSTGHIELYIHVDNLKVSSPIKVPQGLIEIVGEEIVFKEGAYFDVSGEEGQDGGEIYYDFSELKEIGIPSIRFILNGGNGVPSTGGSNGVSGKSVSVLRGNIVFSKYDEHICPSNIDNYEVECAMRVRTSGHAICPTSGTDAVSPTRPGRGGRRGSFLSPVSLTAQIVSSIQAKQGVDAPKTKAFFGGKAGQPNTARFEYHFRQFVGGSTKKNEFKYDVCPTTRDGVSIPELFADNAPRPELPWGRVKSRSDSLGKLKRMDYSLREQVESFTANNLQDLESNLTFLEKSIEEIDSGSASRVLFHQSIYQRYLIQKKYIKFMNRLSEYRDGTISDRFQQEVDLFIGIGNVNMKELESDFFSKFGSVDLTSLQNFSVVRDDQITASLELKELLFRLQYVSDSGEGLVKKVINLSPSEARENLLAHWKSIMLTNDEISRFVDYIGNINDTYNLHLNWSILKALDQLLARNHLLYLISFESPQAVQSYKKRILRDRLMITLQEFAQNQLARGYELSENFVMDFDLGLNQHLATFYFDASQVQIEHLASQLLAPIYRYAQ